MTTMIDALASGLDDELIDVRRRLHTYPELSYREFATTALLVERLETDGRAVGTTREYIRAACAAVSGLRVGDVADVVLEAASDEPVACRVLERGSV